MRRRDTQPTDSPRSGSPEITGCCARSPSSRPEAGALFPGGVSKRQLPALDKSGLELFVRETRRAELGHWWALLAGPVFVLWNPPAIAAVLIGYGIAINLPFIAIQRYNRFRTEPLLRRAR